MNLHHHIHSYTDLYVITYRHPTHQYRLSDLTQLYNIHDHLTLKTSGSDVTRALGSVTSQEHAQWKWWGGRITSGLCVVSTQPPLSPISQRLSRRLVAAGGWSRIVPGDPTNGKITRLADHRHQGSRLLESPGDFLKYTAQFYDYIIMDWSDPEENRSGLYTANDTAISYCIGLSYGFFSTR